MPETTTFATTAEQHDQATYATAATVVLASKFNRPTLRVETARVRPTAHVHFHSHAHKTALRTNRAFLEETVIVMLAAPAAEEIKHGRILNRDALARVEQLLGDTAANDDERDAAHAYLTVLLARARAALRRNWAEVEIISMALQEHGFLDATQIDHRLRCTQGIRSATLN